MLTWEEADRLLRRKRPPRRKAPGPATPASPSPAEVSAVPLVDALTDRDERRREAAAAQVKRSCIPAVVALLCRCLVERLLAGPREGRRAARASLVQVGAAAKPAVYYRLLHARASATQLALVATLAEIGERLSARGRMDLMLDLAIIASRAADDSARQVIYAAVARLRRLIERAASPTAAGRPSLSGPPSRAGSCSGESQPPAREGSALPGERQSGEGGSRG